MILKNSPFSIQDKNTIDLDNSPKKFPHNDDLISEKNITIGNSKTVHRRRDLDSLG